MVLKIAIYALTAILTAFIVSVVLFISSELDVFAAYVNYGPLREMLTDISFTVKVFTIFTVIIIILTIIYYSTRTTSSGR